MPSLRVSQYIDVFNGTPVEPPVAHQTFALTDQRLESAPFNKQARAIRITSDVDCLIGFGQAAVDPQSFIAAGQPELRFIHPDAGFRLTAVLASGEMQPGSVGVLGQGVAFFEILTSPSKYKSLLDKLLKTRDDAQAAMSQLGDLKSKAGALKKERDGFDALVNSHQEQVRQSKADLDCELLAFAIEKGEHAASVAALAEHRAAFETSVRQHEQQLAELNRFKKSFAA